MFVQGRGGRKVGFTGGGGIRSSVEIFDNQTRSIYNCIIITQPDLSYSVHTATLCPPTFLHCQSIHSHSTHPSTWIQVYPPPLLHFYVIHSHSSHPSTWIQVYPSTLLHFYIITSTLLLGYRLSIHTLTLLYHHFHPSTWIHVYPYTLLHFYIIHFHPSTWIQVYPYTLLYF